MACASSCRTKDHASYGECLRSQGIGHMNLGGAGTASYSQNRKFQKETNEYRELVRGGGSIATAQREGLDSAWSKAKGKLT